MTISARQNWTNNNQAGGSSVTLTLGSNPIPGNLVVIFWLDVGGALTGSPIADTFGDGVPWTPILGAPVGSGHLAQGWYKVVGKSVSGNTVSVSTSIVSASQIYGAEYQGNVQQLVVDGTATSNTGVSSANPDPGSITTKGQASLVVGYTFCSGIAPSAGSGFTIQSSSAALGNTAVEDQFTTSAGTYDPNWTAASQAAWAAIGVAFAASLPLAPGEDEDGAAIIVRDDTDDEQVNELAIPLDPVGPNATPIKQVQQASAASTSVAITSTLANDLIVTFAYRSSSATPPTLATGFTQIDTVAQSTTSFISGYKVSAGGDTTSGTWTSATHVACIVLRGAQKGTPIGANGHSNGSSVSLSYPALTLQVQNGTSWVVGFGAKPADAAMAKSAAPLHVKTYIPVASPLVNAQDTEGPVSSFSAVTLTVTSGNWIGETIEILSDPGMNTYDSDPSVELTGDDDQADETWLIIAGDNEQVDQGPTPLQLYDMDPESELELDPGEDEAFWFEVGSEPLVGDVFPATQQPYDDDPAAWSGEDDQPDEWWFDVGAEPQLNTDQGVDDDPATWYGDDDVGEDWFTDQEPAVDDSEQAMLKGTLVWTLWDEDVDDEWWTLIADDEQVAQWFPAGQGYGFDPAAEMDLDPGEDEAPWFDIGSEPQIQSVANQVGYDFDPASEFVGDDDLGEDWYIEPDALVNDPEQAALGRSDEWTAGIDEDPDEDWWVIDADNEETPQAPTPSLPYDFDWALLSGDDDLGDESVWFDIGANDQGPQAGTPQQPGEDDWSAWVGDEGEVDDSWHEVGANDQGPQAPTPQQPRDDDPAAWAADEDLTDDTDWIARNDEFVIQFIPAAPTLAPDDPWPWLIGDEDLGEDAYWFEVGANDALSQTNAPPAIQPGELVAELAGDDDLGDDSLWFDIGANDQGPQAGTPQQPGEDDWSAWVGDEGEVDDAYFFDQGNEQVSQAPTLQQPREDDPAIWTGEDDQADEAWFFEVGANEQVPQFIFPPLAVSMDPASELSGDDDLWDESWAFEVGANDQGPQAATPQQPRDDDPSLLTSDDEPDDWWLEVGANDQVTSGTPPASQQQNDDEAAAWTSDDEPDDWWHDIGSSDAVPQAPTPPQPADADPSLLVADEDYTDDTDWIARNDEFVIQFAIPPALAADDPWPWLLGDDDLGEDAPWFETGANDQISQINQPPIAQSLDPAAEMAVDSDLGEDWYVDQEPAVNDPEQASLGRADDWWGWIDEDLGEDWWHDIGANDAVPQFSFPDLSSSMDPAAELAGDDDVGDDSWWFEVGNQDLEEQAPTPQQPYDYDPATWNGDDDLGDEAVDAMVQMYSLVNYPTGVRAKSADSAAFMATCGTSVAFKATTNDFAAYNAATGDI